MKQKSTFFYGWVVVVACLLITTTMVPPVMALFNTFATYVEADLGVSRSQFTLCNTILQGIGILISPIVAKKLNHGNMKLIQCAGIIGFCACYACYSFVTNIFVMYALSLVMGVFWLCSALIPVTMMITNWFIDKRGLAMSLAMVGIGVGGAVFSPIVSWMLETWGWRHTYQIYALIIILIALPCALFLCKKKPEDIGLLPLGAENAGTKIQSEDKSSEAISLDVKQCWPKFFFWLMLIGMLCNGLINSGALGQFPPAIQEMHGAEVKATIMSIYSLVGIFGKVILGWINDRFGLVASAGCGCAMFGLSFFFMLAGHDTTMLYVMGVVFGLGIAIGTVTPPLVVSAIFGKEKFGEACGIANSFTQVGFSFGSIMVASIYDVNGTYTPAWILLIVLTVVTIIGWIGSYLISRKYVDHEAQPSLS